MKHVIFATSFQTAAKPNAENEFSLFDPLANAYIALGNANNITTFDELVLEYQRDGAHISVPFYPSRMTYSQNEAFTVASAQQVDVDLTTAISAASPTVIAGDTFTLEIIHKGHAHDGRCRKYISVVYGASYNGTVVSSEATLTAAFVYLANLITMPYIDFVASAPGGDIVRFTVQAPYEYEELVINGMDYLNVLHVDTAGSLHITYTHTTTALTGGIMKQIEKDADSMLGDHSTSLRTGEIFTLATGYLGTVAAPTCNSLAVIKSSKPTDDTLALEPNVNQELYIFYDHDVEAATGVTMAEVMDWVLGQVDTLPAS